MTEEFDDSATGDRYENQANALAAWFIGPRAENHELFNKLISQTITQHQQNRRKYWPTDPQYVTKKKKASLPYRYEKKELKQKLKTMNSELEQSTPVFSARFQGHMNWDVSMPAILGYISGMVWNPNNVDVTASPITTPYEILAAEQICDMIGFDDPVIEPWGHITCGGSIANIEAMWAARNMKFYPLSLKTAVMKEPELASARTYQILVPKEENPKPDGDNDYVMRELQLCSNWQMLNLNTDDACSMADGVATATGLSLDKISELAHQYAYTSMGIVNFHNEHNIASPHVFVPATCHYSWPKAATVLGIGEDNLIHIKVDEVARQDVADLREQLDKCVLGSIPVISVTAVIGSTEESAIDPLTEILEIREEYKRKGLNFAVLADAAWGAYMRTILINPDDPAVQRIAQRRKERRGTSVCETARASPLRATNPIAPLSQYAKDNLNAMKLADTVTSDPHKTGYVPYPAGGLSYRNGTMKEFVRLAAPEVFHSADDLSVGVNGLEGSKPGAAGAGVLLSHQVIGLDMYGYGRILGQCVYSSKIYYCLWLHLSKPTDPFVIKPYTRCSEEDKIAIKNEIIGKTDKEISENPVAMDLLNRNGPDCMINKFAVNFKIKQSGSSELVLNPDVDLSTEYSQKIGRLLSVNAGKDNHRVPLVIFQSLMEPETFGPALIKFEQEELGLTQNNESQFGCMVNTVMNPWQASGNFVWEAGEIYRECCLLAYGWQNDPVSRHTFYCGDLQHSVDNGWFFYANYVGQLNVVGHQYECVTKFGISDSDYDIMRPYIANGDLFVIDKDANERVLYQLLLDAEGGLPFELQTANKEIVTLRVLDMPRVNHFPTPSDPDLKYPDHHEYFMYGEDGNIYISHIITKHPDFQQVVKVVHTPMSGEKDDWLLWYGFPVTFTELPVDPANTSKNPLTKTDFTYHIKFIGEKHRSREMDIILKDNTGWFDNTILNTSA